VAKMKCSACSAVHRVDVDCDCGQRPTLGPPAPNMYVSTNGLIDLYVRSLQKAYDDSVDAALYGTTRCLVMTTSDVNLNVKPAVTAYDLTKGVSIDVDPTNPFGLGSIFDISPLDAPFMDRLIKVDDFTFDRRVARLTMHDRPQPTWDWKRIVRLVDESRTDR
jgi:hypothetical protein